MDYRNPLVIKTDNCDKNKDIILKINQMIYSTVILMGILHSNSGMQMTGSGNPSQQTFGLQINFEWQLNTDFNMVTSVIPD